MENYLIGHISYIKKGQVNIGLNILLIVCYDLFNTGIISVSSSVKIQKYSTLQKLAAGGAVEQYHSGISGLPIKTKLFYSKNKL